MSKNSLSADRDVRDFVGHQLALEIDAGTSAGTAAEKLRGTLPPQYHWAIAEAISVLDGEPPPRSWPQLGNLVATARSHGISVERTFAAYQRSVELARASYAGVFAGAMSLGIYLVTISAVLMLLIATYAMWVLPAFREMFAQFGSPLPAFTTVMIGNGLVLVPVLGLLVAVLVLYIVGFTRLKTRMQNMQPVSPGMSWVPGLRQWAHAHDTALWMRFYAVFLDAGAPDNIADQAAAQLAGFSTGPGPRILDSDSPAVNRGDHRPRLLEAAARLGHLRDELTRMIAADSREAAERFERARNTAVLMLRLYVYLLVSGYVIAMYLPIFKLGAVV